MEIFPFANKEKGREVDDIHLFCFSFNIWMDKSHMVIAADHVP